MIKKAVKNEVFWGLILVNISLACFIDRQIFLADALKSVAEEAVIAFFLMSIMAVVFKHGKLASLTCLGAFLIFASTFVHPDETRIARHNSSGFKQVKSKMLQLISKSNFQTKSHNHLSLCFYTDAEQSYVSTH